ncbi:MAG: c-type cytochrome biogenesis protein CcsB [Acidobacteriota bacterium]|nr:c-type cytochrome biogenesis protein CcsB [Acidobacteriota bacterium]MDW3229171.1 c-type cytochrome biogenesis protein CcsB [Acidobacteriota bacterium]MDY0230932.1 c-type cytochrome biogenesis protein CcsB [Candidatus Saccharicenans sp.]
MNEFIFLLVAFFIYFLVMVLGFISLFKPVFRISRVSFYLSVTGFIFHTVSLVVRTIQSGQAPFTSMYESINFLAWSCVLAVIIFERKFRLERIAPYLWLIIVALLALASSPALPKEVTPLVPALQSYWLWLHVSVTLLGEAFLAIAFVVSLKYLLSQNKGLTEAEARERKEKLDLIAYRAVAVGFPLFTLGALVFGMIWASKAWGRYWGWDPKEVWSLITWLFYALYLHTRLAMGWRGKKSALIAVLGFLAALFTFFGVNYLLSGLHSYL